MPTIYGIDPGDLLHVTGGQRAGEAATVPDGTSEPDDITVGLPRVDTLTPPPRPRPPSQPAPIPRR